MITEPKTVCLILSAALFGSYSLTQDPFVVVVVVLKFQLKTVHSTMSSSGYQNNNLVQ